jgi:hypothetical protein
MPIPKHEKYPGPCDRDSEGYLILYTSPHCVRCHKLVGRIEDDDKRRRFQILGYCLQCHLAIMGW